MKAGIPHLPEAADNGPTRELCGSEIVPALHFPEGYAALEWFRHAPGFVAFLTGPDLVFGHVNDAYKRLVGREQLVGLPFHVALPEVAAQGFRALLQEVVASGKTQVERARAVWVLSPDGESQLRYVDFVVQPIPGGEGQDAAGLLVQGCDVTMEMISRRDLQFTLTHDVLTELPNYALSRDRLEHALRRAARVQRPLQVAALDIDQFKRVNVLLGREGGERILHDVARRIERTAGPEVTVAREGGDKFLLLFEGEDHASRTGGMQKIIEALAAPFDYAGRVVYVTCCIGAAAFPLGGKTVCNLLLSADRALARAKEVGPSSLRWDDTPPDGAELEHLRLGFALREALAKGELQVHYQPQVDLVTGAINAVEALVRWTKDGDKVPVATLISLAEECGLIGDLGDWVLRTACAQAVCWREMGFTDLRIAVNLSARQFSMCNLEDFVKSALSDTGLPASCLDLELTEGLLMENLDGAIDSLFALRRLGVRICLDDFGTGYSSLANLRRLPVDVLKIDGSFLKGVPKEDDASAIVHAIIAMGHSLGMRVLAEGVEREEQCEFLSRHMCDELQGHYVCEPVSADAMTGFLRAGWNVAPELLRFNRARPTLLLVDDEPSILSSLRRLLRNEGYRILTANSGTEGLQVLAENDVDVIVSDQRMPGMTGVEFLRTVRQLYPDTVRIVLSGFTELQTVTDAVNAGAIYKFLTKPWDDDQLRSHVQEAFSYGAMADENRLLTLEVRTANQKLAAVNRRLESVLERQRGEIKRGEISLDVVNEALSNVPMPVLASDDLGMIVLANRAALALFGGHGPVLGADIRQLFPALPDELPAGAELSFELRLGSKQYPADLLPMGSESHSRGWLIVVARPGNVLRGAPES